MEQTNPSRHFVPREGPIGKQNLSVKEVAEILGVTDFAVRAWIARRRLAHYKLGRAVRVARSEVDRFLTDSLIPAAPERL